MRSCKTSTGITAKLWLATVMGLVLAAPYVVLGDEPHLCDTMYTGPPGGSRFLLENWSNGIPQRGWVACERSQFSKDDKPGSSASDPIFTPYDPPPAPTMIGACCMGSTCSITDYFDCREQGGHFTQGITACFSVTCEIGACCKSDDTCQDLDVFNQPMEEAACNALGGTFLGEASCGSSDPCQRYRIPAGFEIVDVSANEMTHAWPRINNCGQIVVHIGQMSWWDAHVHLFDNGLATQLTDGDDGFTVTDINDAGTVVYQRDFSGSNADIILLKNGVETLLGTGGFPAINNLGHVVWDNFSPVPPAYPSSIVLFNGETADAIFEDSLSNQSPEINDYDQVVWHRYDFNPESGFGWTSDIMFHDSIGAIALQSSLSQCVVPDISNEVKVAWECVGGTEIWDTVETVLFSDGVVSPDNPTLNARGDLAFNDKDDFTPWQIWLYRDGEFYRISNNADIENLIDNMTSRINEYGEITWRWAPNGGFTPSGTRFMRRIRRGDVNFDGDVDIDDVIPMARCYTGSVITDGLCHCRFYDIDHDRDIDFDDFDLLMRNYVGPLDDCNGNSILDFEELLDGSVADCNFNGVVDTCDITADPLLDSDGDGAIDACCQQAVPTQPINVHVTNRYLTFEVPDSPPAPLTMQGDQQNFPTAIRVTFTPSLQRAAGFNPRGHSASVRAPNSRRLPPTNHRLQTGATLLGGSLQTGATLVGRSLQTGATLVGGSLQTGATLVGGSLQTGATPSPSVSSDSSPSAASDSSPLAKGGSRGVVQMKEDLPQPLLGKEGGSSATLVAESLHTDAPRGLFETPDAHSHTDAPRGLSATLIAHSHTETPRGLKSAARAEGPWVMWVGPPVEVSENGGSVDPVEGFGTFTAATLQCSPYYHDFGSIDALHVYHQAIIPEGQYEIQTIRQGCGSATEVNFSPPLAIDTSRWADSVGPFDGQTWPPPDGVVGIPSDVLATIDKFQSLPTSPSKARVDIAPDTPNRVIDISDITRGIGAFRGEVYPFTVSPPCP